MDDGRSILIVGGGFSGSALAIQLARRGIASTIIETRGTVAQGAAYSTRADEHLLNVPAGKMSLWPDDPHHFADHVEEEGLGPHDFVSRRRFGDYVAGELARAAMFGCIKVVRDRAVRAEPSDHGWTVTLDSGEVLKGSTLVLANGNQPPSPVPVPGLAADRRIDDPWSAEGRARIAALARGDAPVLLMGTGLTMVDVVLTLEREGFRGAVTAVSRRGQVPRAHVAGGVAPLAATLDEVPVRLSAMLWWMRERVGAGEWRGAIDGLRPITQAIWERMGDGERARFLRHLRPWWDVHRHRIAPEAAAVIERMIADKRLTVVAGRAVRADETGELAEVEVAMRRGGTVSMRAAAVINCTGPLGRIDQTDDPLLRQMLADRLIFADRLGIGIEVGADDRVQGQALAWGIGPVTKGKHWEITAVPDIRGQAERIANSIAARHIAHCITKSAQNA